MLFLLAVLLNDVVDRALDLFEPVFEFFHLLLLVRNYSLLLHVSLSLQIHLFLQLLNLTVSLLDL